MEGTFGGNVDHARLIKLHGDVPEFHKGPLLAGEGVRVRAHGALHLESVQALDRSRTHEPIEELTRVALSKPVETKDGVLPAGSMGTVVSVYRGGAAYDVEFAKPFHTLATVMTDAIRHARA